MDRQIIYPGQVPLETDLLSTQRNVMIALGYALQGYLGAGTYVDGFTCVQTSTASQNIQVTPGQILTLANVDNSAFSSLAADTAHQIIKQGLSLSTQTFTCPSPLTVGYAVNYLVEVSQSDIDSGSVLLPYYNPASPQTAWGGPGGAGTNNNTVRTSAAVLQLKAGTPATSGSQVTPTVDPGFVALFVITVAYGQTTITSASISTLASAPFVSLKLPGVPAWVQGQTYNYAVDTGTANAMAITLNPAPTTITAGFSVRVKKMAATSTGAMTITVNGGSATAVVYADASAMSGTQTMASGWMADLTFDGSVWRFTNGTLTTAVGTLTVAAGEGIGVAGSTASLNFPTLTNQTTLGNGDVWAFYSQGDSHHRYLNWLQLVTAIKNAIPVATTTTYGLGRQVTSTEAASGASVGGVYPAFTRIEDVAAYVAAVIGVANTTTRGISRQATLTEATNGATTASVPAFVTPEGLAAYVLARNPVVVNSGALPLGATLTATASIIATSAPLADTIGATYTTTPGALAAARTSIASNATLMPASQVWTVVSSTSAIVENWNSSGSGLFPWLVTTNFVRTA